MDSVELSSSPIPEEELTHLLLTTTDAFRLSAAGETRRGYLKLLGGLVRMSQFTTEQHAWARDLQAHWKHALQEYVVRHPEVNVDDRLRPVGSQEGSVDSDWG